MTPRTRAALVQARVEVILLQASAPTLLARVGDASNRPFLRDDPPSRLQALAAEREPIFAELATMIVETDQRTAGQVAATAGRAPAREGCPP